MPLRATKINRLPRRLCAMLPMSHMSQNVPRFEQNGTLPRPPDHWPEPLISRKRLDLPADFANGPLDLTVRLLPRCSPKTFDSVHSVSNVPRSTARLVSCSTVLARQRERGARVEIRESASRPRFINRLRRSACRVPSGPPAQRIDVSTFLDAPHTPKHSKTLHFSSPNGAFARFLHKSPPALFRPSEALPSRVPGEAQPPVWIAVERVRSSPPASHPR
jgi:hypothetical protein